MADRWMYGRRYDHVGAASADPSGRFTVYHVHVSAADVYDAREVHGAGVALFQQLDRTNGHYANPDAANAKAIDDHIRRPGQSKGDVARG